MTDRTAQTEATTRRGWLKYAPIALIAATAAVGAVTLGDTISFDTLRENRELLLAYRDTHYVAMAAGFVTIYILIVALSLPGAAVASVTGGFLFGLAAGTMFNVAAATVGAAAIFLAARWGLGTSMAARLDASEGKIKTLKTKLHDNEISVLFLLRLVPVVPFFVANLLPALVGVRFSNFLWTTALGIIPGAIVFTWIGVGVGAVFERGGSPDLSLIWEPYIIGPILGLAALAALPIVIKSLRGAKEI